MKYLPLISPYFDEWGLIDKKVGVDGGDTLNKEGLFAVVSYLLFKDGKMENGEYSLIEARYAQVIQKLSAKMWGNYTRHVNPEWWACQPDRMSRDQLIPNVIAMSLMGMHKELAKCFLGHCLRLLLFTTNIRKNGVWKTPVKLPDLTLFEFWSYYIRALPFRALFYPILCVLDLENLVGSLSKTLWYGRTPKNSDDVNHIVSTLYALERCPTIVTYLSRWVYSKRKLSDLTGLERTDFGPYSSLVNYFTPAAGNPPLHLLFKDVMDRLKCDAE